MFERLDAIRIVASPKALDSARLTDQAFLLRLAPDDALVIGGNVEVEDVHAIALSDSGWVAMRTDESRLREMLSVLCGFVPAPGLNQGMVAGLPAKVWLDGDQSMVIVAAPYESELQERLG